MVNSVMLRANAKINVGLHLVGKRADGYHLLETLYYPVPDLTDTLWIERVPGESCTIEMNDFEEDIAVEDNLCYRAWRLMADELEKKKETGLRIRIKKGIPAGAGLGGGSSDAAAVLKALRSLWQPDISDAKLAALGARLGADVPFFIYNRPMYGTGIGTDLEPFDFTLAGLELRVKVFKAHSSTVQAYREVLPEDIGHTQPLRELLQLPIEQWRGRVVNDLEKPVFKRLAFLPLAIAEFYQLGAIYAAMSGSGSACYGLFPR
jgi:4-diphosphocytidyl-2-C-methyl-D-erythritol kinase